MWSSLGYLGTRTEQAFLNLFVFICRAFLHLSLKLSIKVKTVTLWAWAVCRLPGA